MANTKTHTPRSKGHAFWQQHIIAWSKSGLAQSEYCRQHNLSKSAFYNWKCKLKATEFLPVTVQSHSHHSDEAKQDALSIVLPNGCTVSLPLQADPNFVIPWLERLRTLT